MGLFKGLTDRVKAEYDKAKKEREALRKKKEGKLKVLRTLTNPELMKIAKLYISTNPKIQEVDSRGKTIKRTPNRDELIDAILRKVPLDNVYESIPRLRKSKSTSSPMKKKSSTKKKTTKKKTSSKKRGKK